jgi:hypothetical protein
VEGPGVSFLWVPQSKLMMMNSSGVKMGFIEAGGAVELDLPLTFSLGIAASYFVGWEITTMQMGTMSFQNNFFIHYPLFDIYYQTKTSRYSLGLAFQQLASGAALEEMFKNPVLTLSINSRVGRGLAYAETTITGQGMGLGEKSHDFSTPQSAFINNPQAMPPPEPSLKRAAGKQGPKTFKRVKLEAPDAVTVTEENETKPTEETAVTALPSAGTPAASDEKPPPLSRMQEQEQEWFYVLNHEQRGPVSLTELQRLFAAGVINGATMVWKEGYLQWQTYESINRPPPLPNP